MLPCPDVTVRGNNSAESGSPAATRPLAPASPVQTGCAWGSGAGRHLWAQPADLSVPARVHPPVPGPSQQGHHPVGREPRAGWPQVALNVAPGDTNLGVWTFKEKQIKAPLPGCLSPARPHLRCLTLGLREPLKAEGC